MSDMTCRLSEKCVNYGITCLDCKLNPIYSDVPSRSLFQEYIPTCPQGYSDCIYDPAYIKCYDPDWYKELYGDLTPEEAMLQRCNPEDEYCYDDEDK